MLKLGSVLIGGWPGTAGGPSVGGESSNSASSPALSHLPWPAEMALTSVRARLASHWRFILIAHLVESVQLRRRLPRQGSRGQLRAVRGKAPFNLSANMRWLTRPIERPI